MPSLTFFIWCVLMPFMCGSLILSLVNNKNIVFAVLACWLFFTGIALFISKVFLMKKNANIGDR
jgi:hypothetical protein